MKQTAVDYLFQELWQSPKDKLTWYYILKKSKKIEKRQIEDAYYQAYNNGFIDNGKSPDEYYKETYEQ